MASNFCVSDIFAEDYNLHRRICAYKMAFYHTYSVIIVNFSERQEIISLKHIALGAGVMMILAGLGSYAVGKVSVKGAASTPHVAPVSEQASAWQCMRDVELDQKVPSFKKDRLAIIAIRHIDENTAFDDLTAECRKILTTYQDDRPLPSARSLDLELAVDRLANAISKG